SLFFGKAACATCHEVNGRGGITAPELSAAGTRSADALRSKILNPNTAGVVAGGRGPAVVVVKTQDGREIEGVRRSEDTFKLQMVYGSGQLHLLDKSKLATVRSDNRSLMPGDYASRLTGQELEDVVAYLGTLKERDLNKTAAAVIPGGITYERL